MKPLLLKGKEMAGMAGFECAHDVLVSRVVGDLHTLIVINIEI